MSEEDVKDAPEPRQPIEVICTRCWRAEALPLHDEADTAADAAFDDWHQTKSGWVCGHCWTGLDHVHEQQLCRLCGRDARPGEDKHEDWRGPDEAGDFLCPECHIAGEDSVRVQLVKKIVRRWQRAGKLPTGWQARIDDELARERKIVVALLRARVELEGARPTDDEWERMVSRALEAATAAWPEPVGQQQDD